MIDRILTLWDSPAHPPKITKWVYTWNGSAETGSTYSLLRYVEKHGDRLRGKYLAWVHDLGESRVRNKRLIDHLALEGGFSYWWMTLLVEKSLYKSPISDAIRLLALEEIVVEQRPSKIRLVSSNRALSGALNNLCESVGVSFEWVRLPGKSFKPLGLGYVYRALPHSVQALVYLVRFACSRWSFRKAEKSGWFSHDTSLFFCSYFFNIDPMQAKEGNFHSRYWEDLHGLMKKLGLLGNWLQHYYPHDAVPSPQVAMDWVQRFNLQGKGQSFHTFLDAYLTWQLLLRVLKRWLKLMIISWRLKEIENVFSEKKGQVFWLWPIIRDDWYASMRGSVSIFNLLWVELFDRALQELPRQKKGLYLCENHAWEKALNYFWRKHGHGQLIAVVHATVRFWDLRYFNDSRTIQSSKLFPMPQADLTALNGKAAVDAYLNAGYPKKGIIECEALRYGYLNRIRAGSRKEKKGEAIKVLVLGDSVSSSTIKMLRLLEGAIPNIRVSATYTMKPHPNCSVNPADYPSLNLKVVVERLEDILCDFDIAYSSNKTSAGVDAYLVGVPVVVMLDDTELNFSALREKPGVSFVSTPEELAEVLQMTNQNVVGMQDDNDFFFLDPELPRWRKLLSPE